MTADMLTALGTGVMALTGGGLIGLIGRYIKHSNELAVTKHILSETQKKLEVVIIDVAALKTSSVEIHTKMEQFIEVIKKLDMIPRLDAKLDAVERLVSQVQDVITSLRKERTI